MNDAEYDNKILSHRKLVGNRYKVGAKGDNNDLYTLNKNKS